MVFSSVFITNKHNLVHITIIQQTISQQTEHHHAYSTNHDYLLSMVLVRMNVVDLSVSVSYSALITIKKIRYTPTTAVTTHGA